MSPTKDFELTPVPAHFRATSSPARSQAAVDSRHLDTSGTSELPPHVQPILHSTGIPAPDIGVGSVVRHFSLVENQSDQRNLHMSHHHGYKSKPVLPHVQFPATFNKSTREVVSKNRDIEGCGALEEGREEWAAEREGERGGKRREEIRGGREEEMVGREGGGGGGEEGSRDGTPESWHSLPLEEEGVEKEAPCFQQGREAAGHTKTEGMVAC